MPGRCGQNMLHSSELKLAMLVTKIASVLIGTVETIRYSGRSQIKSTYGTMHQV